MKRKTVIVAGTFISLTFCNANAVQVSRKEFLAKVNAQRVVLLRSLQRLERSDPKSDVQRAIKKKDFRFIAYNGIAVMVPGVGRGAANTYVERNGVNIIQGTSDVIDSSDSRRLRKQVARYVIPYNKALMAYLTKRKQTTKSN